MVRISGHRSISYNRDPRLTCYRCGKSLNLELILGGRNGKKKCLTCAVMTISITATDISLLQKSIKDGTMKNLVFFNDRVFGEQEIRYTKQENPQTLEIQKEIVKTQNGKTKREFLKDVVLRVLDD